ncbi:hypothetical protein evm_011844 [Chilo suppressalis]|nr:hypothetical protein evm_011844 [Chilo suppressalis]
MMDLFFLLLVPTVFLYKDSTFALQQNAVYAALHANSANRNSNLLRDIFNVSLLTVGVLLAKKCNIQEADNEYRQQALIDVNYFEVKSDEEITELSEYWRSRYTEVYTSPVFWNEVLNLKDHHGNYKHQNLEIVISLLLALPSPNTEVEILFSVLKNVNSNKRNKLSNETLNGLLHTKLGMTGSILEPDSVIINAAKKLKAGASVSASESYSTSDD